MSFSCKTGNFLTGTGAVASTVSVSGLGFTPKVVLFYHSGRTEAVDTVGRLDQNQGWGVGVSAASRIAITLFSDNAVAASDTCTRHDNANCVSIMLNATTVDGSLDLQSLDADGYTLVVTNQFGTSYRIYYLALGGADLTNIKLSNFQEPAATGAQQTTGVGFQPDCLLFWGTQLGSPPTTFTDARACFGAATGSASANQAVWSGGSNDAAATSQTMAYCKSGEVIALFDSTVTSLNGRASLTSMDTDGFTLNWSERNSTRELVYLALKGGSYLVNNALTQTDLVTTIVSDSVANTLRGGLVCSAARAESVADTPTDHDFVSMGGFDSASSRNACGSLDEDNLTPTEVTDAIEFDEVYLNISTGSAIQGLMDVQTMGTTSVTWIMDDADPSQAFFFYVLFGDATVPSPAPDLSAALTVSALAGASETSYYLIINDAFGNRLAVVQDYEAITAKRTVNGVGALVFTLPGYYSIDTFKVDGIVELWRAPKGGSWRLEFQQLWFIRERYKVIQGGVRRWKIVAYDLNYLLGEPSGRKGRIVAYTSDYKLASNITDAFTDKAGTADDIIKRVASENIGSLATDVTRSLATYLSIQANLSAAASVTAKMERRNLLNLFQELAQASTTAGTYLAFEIVCLTPPNNGTFSIELQTFTGQRGIDHRLSSSQPVLVGPDFGNLDDAILGFINTDEVNYVYAAGQNESANQSLITSSDSTRYNISPFNRREAFVNVGQTADPATIADEADTALRAGRPFLSLTGTLIDTDQARYGIHWNFGDYITAQIDTYSFDARLDTLTLNFNRDNGERISAQVRAESVT